MSCPVVIDKGPMSVVLEGAQHNGNAKGLKWQQKESIAQAVSIVPLISGLRSVAIFIVIFKRSASTRLTTGAWGMKVVLDD